MFNQGSCVDGLSGTSLERPGRLSGSGVESSLVLSLAWCGGTPGRARTGLWLNGHGEFLRGCWTGRGSHGIVR